jgi:hypothetical protein
MGFSIVCIPDHDHVVVHLLELLLGHLQGVRRGIELIGLEAFVAEPDGEGLILGLDRTLTVSHVLTKSKLEEISPGYRSLEIWWC